MRISVLLAWMLCVPSMLAAAEPGVPLISPGFSPSHLDAAGRLVEDWGTFGVRLGGEGIVDAAPAVQAILLDEVVRAAQAIAERGSVRLVCTAYRAPVFPLGVDVYTVRLEEVQNREAHVTLELELPPEAQVGAQAVKVGRRSVLALPQEALADQDLRDWGYCDDATSLKGWGKPQGSCDPAFRNIRAGMGGVPIVYRFRVTPRSQSQVVLGFCESHWAESGKRLLNCRVEGAPPQTVDPVAKWGQHKPGALVFAARDENGDGMLEVAVRPAAGTADRNPILSAVWLFPAGKAPAIEEIVAGKRSASAERYVDVGGDNDQSLFPPGKVEYRVALSPGEVKEYVFLAACTGGDVPVSTGLTWTSQTLRKAARDVWRDWPAETQP